MDVSLLRHTAACQRYGQLKAMKFAETDKQRIFSYSLLDKIRAAACMKEDLQALVEKEFRSFPLDAFATNVEALAVKEQEFLRFQRLLTFIEREGEVVAVNAKYFVPCNGRVLLRDTVIQNLTGKADFVFYKTGVHKVVKISLSAPVHSPKARKFCNKVESNIDLIAMKLGFENTYPRVEAGCFYMKGKKDSGGCVPVFSESDNTIASDFSGFYVDGSLKCDMLLDHLRLVLASQEAKDCKSCREKAVCKLGAVRVPEVTAAVAKKRVTTFTQEQLEAVEHRDGPLSIVAVPGAGKTAVLTERLVRLVESGVSSTSILFVTFANKACDEIRERVESFLPEGTELPEILTLNALGFKIVRENRAILGKKVLADDICRLDLIRKALNHAPLIQGVSYRGIEEEFGLLRKLDSAFQKIEEDGVKLYAERNPKMDMEGLLHVKKVYDRMYQEGGYIGFEDQIKLAVELLRTYPSILKKYQGQYRYIMVDEYQDTDGEQVELLRLLGGHGNVVAVGDDDQNIYSFRGCSNRHLLNFGKYFPGAKQIVLSDNFRSRGGIISSFAAFIEGNKERCQKAYLSHRTGGVKPVMFTNYSREQVSGYIQSAINTGYELGDICLISRNNKALEDWADYLSPSYKVSDPKDYLVRDTVFLVFKAVLEVCLDERCGHGCDRELYQLLMHSNIPVPYKTRENASASTLYERMMLSGMPYHGVEIHAGNSSELIEFANKLRSSLLEIDYYSGDYEKLIRTIASLWFGFTEHPVLDHFIRFFEEQQFSSVKEFLQYIRKLIVFGSTQRVGYEPNPDSISLLTAHDSKGKEFPVVLVCDVEDFSFMNEEEKQEERRLLFVAMSRARDNLALFSSPNGKASFAADLSHHVNVA